MDDYEEKRASGEYVSPWFTLAVLAMTAVFFILVARQSPIIETMKAFLVAAKPFIFWFGVIVVLLFFLILAIRLLKTFGVSIDRYMTDWRD